MKREALASLSTDDLVQQFADACVGQDKAIMSERLATFKKFHAQMKTADQELRRRGRDARLALLTLYDHPNMQVRLQAATFTVALAPDAARQLLHAIARSNWMPQAADARGALRNLDEGVFKPT